MTSDVLFRQASVLNPDTAELTPDQDVLVVGRRIAEVDSRIVAPQDARVIALGGMTLTLTFHDCGEISRSW